MLTDRIDAEVMDAGKRLKVISTCAVGFDNIDVAAATARKILVCNTPGVLTEATADLTWALLLATARRVTEADAVLRARGSGRAGRRTCWWAWSCTARRSASSVSGGSGRPWRGRAQGFGMRVLYSSGHRKPEAEQELGAEYADLETLLQESDIVTLHVPLTEQTRGLIGAAELARMKPTARLLNTARGPVVDEGALVAALRDGVIAGAGLDVFDVEPLPMDSPLLALENVVLLPHLGSATVATRTRMAMMAVENLVAGITGERPPYLVNPEVLS